VTVAALAFFGLLPMTQSLPEHYHHQHNPAAVVLSHDRRIDDHDLLLSCIQLQEHLFKDRRRRRLMTGAIFNALSLKFEEET